MSATVVPVNEDGWARLVRTRRRHLRRFLSWAEGRDAAASMRLRNRPDLARAREVLHSFDDPWWAIVVYSCFDSTVGTRAVAGAFRSPVDPTDAERLLASLDLPKGAVQHHRTQPGNKGAKTALISACRLADEFEHILLHGRSFHDRYESLRGLPARQWGRTTCFDLVLRAGQIGIGGRTYEPDRAYLADSTGPRKGFELVWGIEVTRTNADECEGLLRRWSERWHEVADQAGISWQGDPYGPGDLENALCIFQEPGNDGYGRIR